MYLRWHGQPTRNRYGFRKPVNCQINDYAAGRITGGMTSRRLRHTDSRIAQLFDPLSRHHGMFMLATRST